MQPWEYQVIHLNVDSTPAKEGVVPTPEVPPSPPPFTKTYLEQEFPSHYGPQQPPGAAAPTPAQQSQHPAVQLQGFMNTHGRQGWELLGIFPLGNMLMMIFRRPLQLQVGGAAPQTTHTARPEVPARPVPTTQQSNDAVSLEAVLDRLVALEHRLADASADPAPAREAQMGPQPMPAVPQEQRRRPNSSVWILSEEHLRGLSGQPVCSTAQASRSLGFRSPASLLNQAALHGYPIGLVRIGPNGKAAVYQGVGPNRQGGRDLRLWWVVNSQLLPPAPSQMASGEP